MIIHLIASWEHSRRPGRNDFITACGVVGDGMYGSSYQEDVTCEDCLKVDLDSFDEFANLPQSRTDLMERLYD